MQISHTPPSHCIGLGKCVTADHMLRHFRNRADAEMLMIVKHEIFVGFIGNDHQVVFQGNGRQCPKVRLRDNGPCGISRRADENRLCPGCNGLFHGIQVVGKPLVLNGRYQDRHAACQFHLANMG